jgi:polar amino acid transport system substrate-binding protein
MKKRLWQTIICVFMFSSLCSANEKILIYTNNYEPYYGEDMPDSGPVLKITRLAFRETGYEVDVRFKPWARAISEGEKGECDVIAGVWFNTGREGWMALTDPILENEIGFYKRKNDDLVFKNYADLKAKGVVIGIVRSYINPEGFDQWGLRVEEVADDVLNIRKLMHQRIRLVLVDRQVGAFLLKKEGLAENGMEWLVTLQKIGLCNAVMKNAQGDWKKKRDDFNKGLEILKRKGVIQEILKAHDRRF